MGTCCSVPRSAHITPHSTIAFPCHPEERSDVGTCCSARGQPTSLPLPASLSLVIPRSAATWGPAVLLAADPHHFLFPHRSLLSSRGAQRRGDLPFFPAVSPHHFLFPHRSPLSSREAQRRGDLLFLPAVSPHHFLFPIALPCHPEERSDVGTCCLRCDLDPFLNPSIA